MDMIRDSFTIIGFVVVASVIYFSITGLLEAIAEAIRKAKRKYQIKHRFDKPPTAKCYCKDCRFYDEYGDIRPEMKGYCRWFDFTVDDDWFCCEADPKK